MSDVQQPPMLIEIQHPVEKHDVKDEVIEHVARLLCRADGKNPDADIRVSDDQQTFITVHLPYPANMQWYAYKGKAEQKLKELFK